MKTQTIKCCKIIIKKKSSFRAHVLLLFLLFSAQIFPLISQSRWLVKHGELLEVDTPMMSISGSKLKLPTKPVYLHLFNDCLLLSRRKESVPPSCTFKLETRFSRRRRKIIIIFFFFQHMEVHGVCSRQDRRVEGEGPQSEAAGNLRVHLPSAAV